MTIVLGILGGVAAACGGIILSQAQSAIHEIEAFILFLIAAVFLSGGAVVEAINAARIKVLAALGTVAREIRVQPPSTPRERDEVIPTTPPDDPTHESLIASCPPVELKPIAASVITYEAGAKALYAQASHLAGTGQRDKAITALRDVVRLYPQSTAAARARHSLEKSGVC